MEKKVAPAASSFAAAAVTGEKKERNRASTYVYVRESEGTEVRERYVEGDSATIAFQSRRRGKWKREKRTDEEENEIVGVCVCRRVREKKLTERENEGSLTTTELLPFIPCLAPPRLILFLPLSPKTTTNPMFTGVCLVRSSLGLRCEEKSENGGCWFAWWCHKRESPEPPLRHQKFTM
ncbi:hypothetical protein PIB30_098109, partial [Stylosanthes scabra]|nr:hypothetical protein [Stylosanthes scabra]